MTPKTLKRYNTKWPGINFFNILYLHIYIYISVDSSQNVWELYLANGFYNKMLFETIFQSNSKSFHLFVVVFLCIPPVGRHI
jgi:hypothetical protein